jgi:hypothetical protein
MKSDHEVAAAILAGWNELPHGLAVQRYGGSYGSYEAAVVARDMAHNLRSVFAAYAQAQAHTANPGNGEQDHRNQAPLPRFYTHEFVGPDYRRTLYSQTHAPEVVTVPFRHGPGTFIEISFTRVAVYDVEGSGLTVWYAVSDANRPTMEEWARLRRAAEEG